MKKFEKRDMGEVIFGIAFLLFLASGGFIANNNESLQPSAILEKIKVTVADSNIEPSKVITINNSPLYTTPEKRQIIFNLKPNMEFKPIEVTRYQSNNKIAMVKIQVNGKFGWVSVNDVRLESNKITKIIEQ